MRRTTIILLFLLNVLTSVWAARSVDWSKRIVPKSCEASVIYDLQGLTLEGKLAPQLRHNCQSTAPQLFRSCPAKPRPLMRISWRS